MAHQKMATKSLTILVQSTAAEGLNVEISIDDFDKSHRLNKLRKNKEKGQPIIVKNAKNRAFF